VELGGASEIRSSFVIPAKAGMTKEAAIDGETTATTRLKK